MTSKLPFPQSRKTWVIALFLIALYLPSYYYFFYSPIEIAYYDNFWNRSSYEQSQSPITVYVLTPRYVYSFVKHEIKIQVTNLSDSTTYQARVVAKVSKEGDEVLVLSCEDTSEKSTGCGQGSSVLLLGDIPPGGTVTKSFWVSIHNTQPGLITSKLSGEIKFIYLLDTKPVENVRLNSKEFIGEIAENWDREEVTLSGSSTSTIDLVRAFSHSFIKIFLLPPWSNGLIPLSLLLLVWLYERQITERPIKEFGFWRCLLYSQMVYLGGLLLFIFWPQTKLLQGDELEGALVYVWAGLILFALGFIFTWYDKCIQEEQSGINDPRTNQEEVNTAIIKLHQDLQYLISHPESAPSVIKILQKRYPSLPELENYFSAIGASISLPQSIVVKSARVTSSSWLKDCASPDLIRQLFMLAFLSKPPRFNDNIIMMDALINANNRRIDDLLKEALAEGKENVVLRILNGFQVSNRSVGDMIGFFEFIQQPSKDEIKLIVSALFRAVRSLLEFDARIKILLEKAAKSKMIDGPLMREVDDDVFKKQLLEIGKKVSMKNLENARWFIYEELSWVRGNLVEEFFPFLQLVIPYLKRNVTRENFPDITDSFRLILEHDWFDPKQEKIGEQPPAFRDTYKMALTTRILPSLPSPE